jgi:outer membrane protein TolC
MGALALWWGLASPAQAQGPGAADTLLTLAAAVDLALEYYPSVRAARAGETGAAARAGQASAAWWPSFTADGSLVRFQKQMLVFPIHELSQDAFVFDRTLVQGALQLGWTLFDGFGRSARVKGARAHERAAEARVASAQMGLISEVTVAYLEVLSARGTLDAQLQSLAALAAERDRIEQLLAQGQAARVERLRVDAAYAETEAERIATAARLDTAERRLARLLGIDVEAARAARLVPVRLAHTRHTEERTVLLQRFEAANPELQEGAQAEEARAQYELARLRGHEVVDRALAAVEEQRARVEAIATAVEHLVEVARIERLALEAGRGTQTDYLGAEASLRRARASLVQARHAEIAARVELGRVAGELTPSWLSAMLETVP